MDPRGLCALVQLGHSSVTGAFKTQASPRSKSLSLEHEQELFCWCQWSSVESGLATSCAQCERAEPLQLRKRLPSHRRLDETEILRLDVPSAFSCIVVVCFGASYLPEILMHSVAPAVECTNSSV